MLPRNAGNLLKAGQCHVLCGSIEQSRTTPCFYFQAKIGFNISLIEMFQNFKLLKCIMVLFADCSLSSHIILDLTLGLITEC